MTTPVSAVASPVPATSFGDTIHAAVDVAINSQVGVLRSRVDAQITFLKSVLDAQFVTAKAALASQLTGLQSSMDAQIEAFRVRVVGLVGTEQDSGSS